ncbi:hypothetical protein SD77_4441 [Bacillus badius]|uniref:Uncharacterized protein n=1 Tax=Bacillus badius TaxID=1455 RepID=A0ABR5AVI5_BACBA|nr:hypothetical protein SD78_0747 [Bacillus badius]KIL78761.1 hypothetical protein SD77_4441 [Bacillus badius]
MDCDRHAIILKVHLYLYFSFLVLYRPKTAYMKKEGEIP